MPAEVANQLDPARCDRHWIDAPFVGNSRTFNRAIKNWSTYTTPAGIVCRSGVAPDIVDGPPPGWDGACEFSHKNLGAPCQTFVGDTSDTNTALWGMRYADRPDRWLNIKAIGVNPVSYTRTGEVYVWDEAWANTKLEITTALHKIHKLLTLSDVGHPLSFGFSLSYPQGWMHTIVANGLVVSDDQGRVAFTTSPVNAWDSSPGGAKSIGATLRDGAPLPGGYPTIWIDLDAEDCVESVYPCFVDPSTSITGTTDIQDGYVFAYNFADSANDANSGGSAQMGVYYYDDGKGGFGNGGVLIATTAAAIPAGLISAFTLSLVKSSGSNFTVTAYRMKDANDWPSYEGTADNAAQSGSCCGNKKIYNTANWASGNSVLNWTADDYYTTPTPSTVIAAGTNTWTLPTTWATDWRDAVRLPNGVVLFGSFFSTGNMLFSSTEAASNQPQWDVTYSTGGGGVAVFIPQYRRRRT